VNPRDREKMFGEDGKTDTTWTGASGLAADVRYYGEWMREKAWDKIGHLYPTYNGQTVLVWLWAKTIKSPNPAIDSYVPLVKNFLVSDRKNDKTWIVP
jgi:putative DNA methylase